MSPFEHGEVFVLDDGGEVWNAGGCSHLFFGQQADMSAFLYVFQADLDLGNYERFLDITLTRDSNITTGKIYQVRSPMLWRAVHGSHILETSLCAARNR